MRRSSLFCGAMVSRRSRFVNCNFAILLYIFPASGHTMHAAEPGKEVFTVKSNQNNNQNNNQGGRQTTRETDNQNNQNKNNK